MLPMSASRKLSKSEVERATNAFGGMMHDTFTTLSYDVYDEGWLRLDYYFESHLELYF